MTTKTINLIANNLYHRRDNLLKVWVEKDDAIYKQRCDHLIARINRQMNCLATMHDDLRREESRANAKTRKLLQSLNIAVQQ